MFALTVFENSRGSMMVGAEWLRWVVSSWAQGGAAAAIVFCLSSHKVAGVHGRVRQEDFPIRHGFP